MKNLLNSTEITTSDGRWFTIRIMPYRTYDDRITGLVMTFREITTSKQLELKVKHFNDALAISETRYRRLFETSKDGILMLDAESGKITDANPFLLVLLGYTKDQLVEKTIWELGFLNDVLANKEKFIELQQKEFVRYEGLPLETADGRYINVEFVSNVFFVNDTRVIQCQIRELKTT